MLVVSAGNICYLSCTWFATCNSITIHVRQVYELMLKCWEQMPENRITFSQLIDELTRMMQQLQPQNDF